MRSSSAEWRSRLEMLGGTGAAVLGAGVGLLFRQALAPFAVPLVVTGLVAHGLGMYGKHRIDVAADVTQGGWILWGYRLCWMLLAGLLVYVVAALLPFP